MLNRAMAKWLTALPVKAAAYRSLPLGVTATALAPSSAPTGVVEVHPVRSPMHPA
jgi:hypothetical protein